MSSTNAIDLDQLIVSTQNTCDELLARGAVDDANKKTYNLAADLAECWPGDEQPREPRHLEAGVAAAERCLAWRRELGKGPGPFAIAHWAHGMHLLSLAHRAGAGRRALLDRAVAALADSVECARRDAEDRGARTALDADGDYLVITNAGFLAVAREMASPGSGRAALDEARAAFRAQAERHADRREDALFGLASLDMVARRFLD